MYSLHSAVARCRTVSSLIIQPGTENRQWSYTDIAFLQVISDVMRTWRFRYLWRTISPFYNFSLVKNFSSFLPVRNYGMEFRFSRNDGTIKRALHLRWPAVNVCTCLHELLKIYINFDKRITITQDIISHVTRKPVFRVCHQIRLKPACTATDTS